MDFMLLRLANDERCLLPPSVRGAIGLFMVFVEWLRLSDGIIEVLVCLTLAERARDALVGVVAALGNPVRVHAFKGIDWVVTFSDTASLEDGRAADASSE